MGDPKGFLKVKRRTSEYRPVCERVRDHHEVAILCPSENAESQASRCMDCGTPFCHWGCPVGNNIPEWNDMVFRGRWKEAFHLLDATNNLPEITGRVCPAPCEHSCVLGINDDPVTIRENELSIIEKAFSEGYIRPFVPDKRTGRKVAVVGSGPAGLACAAQLNRAGHEVTVYERDERAGGILRYGIPDFKLQKSVLDRRISLMEKEGVMFVTGVDAGKDIPSDSLLEANDAVCLATGSRVPRGLDIEGKDLSGIYFAMDYLTRNNRIVSGEVPSGEAAMDARGRKVVVIGGGDTGSDCVGTAHRQGASCVVQIEVMPKPGECRGEDYPWPKYPLLLKTSSSHEEGGERYWSVLTKRFIGEGGKVRKLECSRVEFVSENPGACPVMTEVPGTSFEIEADMVILAVGFIHPEHEGLISDLGISLDVRKNVMSGSDMRTNIAKVFVAGDARRGQSLVVWAIQEGRKAAYCIDRYLQGISCLDII